MTVRHHMQPITLVTVRHHMQPTTLPYLLMLI